MSTPAIPDLIEKLQKIENRRVKAHEAADRMAAGEVLALMAQGNTKPAEEAPQPQRGRPPRREPVTEVRNSGTIPNVPPVPFMMNDRKDPPEAA